ncbi:hydroxyethylthiazole kinase [Alkalihalobacillus sp. MEB130]|uniref:hydroxyethylthiazole kinase n=1 Tax=Alkalihalobacillus sp. MEB130 TaxID=2976704 RepID=UPI0028DF1178|nr:hydroxyethylthiazole kinase [Alkalihalobacillus sp. MEB130]MDT8858598.1 hydroxyethylthiazole kinase [Alkalihalobacillus sp. MEB130]
MLERIRKENPLVHCMTNVVVTNFTANGLLALGASPVMAYAKEEVADLASIAGALLLNIGTLSQDQVDQMIVAGQAANRAGVPVILDPVGAGATAFRTESSMRILREVNITVLRGNAGEIASLVGVKAEVKGVDGNMEGDKVQLAMQAATQFKCVCVVTGEVDVVTDGTHGRIIHNGHPWMTKVVGTGCLLGGVIASFVAINGDDLIEAITGALTYYGIAGEQAYEETSELGIGSYQQVFVNKLHLLEDQEIKALQRTETF